MGKYEAYDMIFMCFYNETDAAWEVGGFSFFGTAVQLSIDGNSGGEYFWIQRYADELAGGECKFDDFTDRFDHQYGPGHVLTVDAAAGTDYIYGSQYGDHALYGERVDGREGDDRIYLQTDSVTYPVAYGGPGEDLIYGTFKPDYVWGDDVGEYGTGDYIYGYEGNDKLAGVFGADVVVGGDGRDELWGGEGGNDELHPDQIDVNTGYIDTCHGGAPDPPDPETDECWDCEIPDSCND
ncbi:MAG: calcium-binding protein [Polyangia bacterium]